MVRRLRPWHENLGKRQVKTPKVYLRDSGMYHTLLGIHSLQELRRHPKLGPSWEGFALEEVVRRLLCAMVAAVSIAKDILSALAMFWPAMSKAVP